MFPVMSLWYFCYGSHLLLVFLINPFRAELTINPCSLPVFGVSCVWPCSQLDDMEAKRLEDLNAAASAEGADDETKARCVRAARRRFALNPPQDQA